MVSGHCQGSVQACTRRVGCWSLAPWHQAALGKSGLNILFGQPKWRFADCSQASFILPLGSQQFSSLILEKSGGWKVDMFVEIVQGCSYQSYRPSPRGPENCEQNTKHRLKSVCHPGSQLSRRFSLYCHEGLIETDWSWKGFAVASYEEEKKRPV